MSGPISEEDWALARRQSTDAVLERIERRKALLPYQARTVSLLEGACPVLFVEKSRRIGLTWACAAYAVLRAARSREAGGMDFMYISYSQEMTREFIDAAAMWARSFSSAAMEMEEFLFDDSDKDGERAIQAFRIKFASGFEIVGLSSAPRTLRGKQGVVMIDEAAFVDSLEELLKAALAFLMWGGQVIVCSTHDGFENHFNEQVQDILAGKSSYAHLRIDFDDALRDGLYERICLVTGKEWSPEAEAAWRASIIKFYGSGADEELFCMPSLSSGAYLSRALIVSRMREDIPVIRWHPPQGFVDWPKELREAEVEAFCNEQLLPHLSKLDRHYRSCLGQDFGRTADLSVIHPLQVRPDLTLATPFILELRDVPYTSQFQIVCFIKAHLPRFFHAAFDATGNGAALAELARQEFGAVYVSEIKLSEVWYMVNMPKLKAAFDDGLIELPKDDDILNDYRALKMQRGIAKVPVGFHNMGADGFERHGDAAPAGALAVFASEQDSGEIGAATTEPRPSAEPMTKFSEGFNLVNRLTDLFSFTRF